MSGPESEDGFAQSDVGATVAPCPLLAQRVNWLEIEMVGEDDQPLPWLRYAVTLPDGERVEGYLDDAGFARLDGIAPGACRVTFPEFDQAVWQFVSTAGPKPA